MSDFALLFDHSPSHFAHFFVHVRALVLLLLQIHYAHCELQFTYVIRYFLEGCFHFFFLIWSDEFSSLFRFTHFFDLLESTWKSHNDIIIIVRTTSGFIARHHWRKATTTTTTKKWKRTVLSVPFEFRNCFFFHPMTWDCRSGLYVKPKEILYIKPILFHCTKLFSLLNNVGLFWVDIKIEYSILFACLNLF